MRLADFAAVLVVGAVLAVMMLALCLLEQAIILAAEWMRRHRR